MIDKAHYVEKARLARIGGITHVLVEDLVSGEAIESYPASRLEIIQLSAQKRAERALTAAQPVIEVATSPVIENVLVDNTGAIS